MPTPESGSVGRPPPPLPAAVVAVAALAAEELVQAAVDVAPDLVEIGRSAGTAFAPLGIVQRHIGRENRENRE